MCSSHKRSSVKSDWTWAAGKPKPTSLPGWGSARTIASAGTKCLLEELATVLNRAATALRLGASTLLKSQTYLGAQYRRLRSKLGAPKAITARAHRLARL